jgi:hypothetical protein
MPPGDKCIQWSSFSYRELCCSDGRGVYCYTEDGAESYCTVLEKPESIRQFFELFNELQAKRGYEIRGDTKISAFTKSLR